MDLDYVLITIFLSLLSLLTNFWVTYVYIKNKDLQKHPSTILACISVFEIIQSQHSIALALETNFSVKGVGPHHMIRIITLFYTTLEDSKSISCAINQMFFTGAITGVMCYNMFLCLDLIITLRNPLIPGKDRMKIYHILAFILISAQVGYNVYWNSKYDECKLENGDYLYEVWNYGMLTIVYGGYISTAVISVGYSIYKLRTKGKYINSATKEYLTKHIKYIIVLSFIWSWTATNFWLDYNSKHLNEFDKDHTWIITISLILINISGFIQAILRNWEKSFWVKSKQLCKRRRLSAVNSALSTEISGSMVFSNDFKETDDMWNMPTSFIMQESLKSNTTLCILLGIHETFKRECQAYYSIPITESHIKEVCKHKVYFNDVQYRLPIINFYSFPYFIIEEHCPKIFCKLRALENLEISKIIESLHPENNQRTLLSIHQELGGSGSLFIFTEDHKFAVKIITPKERDFLKKKLLFKYYQHIEKNRYSLLNRLLGLFTIKVPGLAPLDMVVFPGLVDDNVEKFYDLKGSTQNRLSTRPDYGFFKGPYKDSDFIKDCCRFSLSQMMTRKIQNLIKKDVKFLMASGIMDYSLIVCISKSQGEKSYKSTYKNEWYKFGIIDFLGEYSFKRKAEYISKIIRYGSRVKMCSVMNPQNYYNRFLKFIKESVFE